MRLKVRVIYRGKSTIFDLPVGEGRHSIKWLGVTAAQRLAYSARSNGRRRKRDAGACTGLSGTNAQLMPSRVCTTHNPFLHPDKIICEELQDDEEVLVIISAGKPLDGIGCPVEDRWAMIAFFPSDQAAERRELALQEEWKILDAKRQTRNNKDAARTAIIDQQKAAEMRKIMEAQLLTDEKVEEAFEDDWVKMDNPVFQPLDKLVPSEVEQQNMKDAMRGHYLHLSELFKSYSSVGAGIRTNDMDLMEFSSFMHDSKIFQGNSRSRDVTDRIFQESSNIRVSKASAGTPHAMELYEFMFALIQLSLIKYQVPGFEDAKQYRVGGMEGRITAESPSDALQRLLLDYISPILEDEAFTGLRVKRALDDDKILALFYDRHEQLQQVFYSYGKAVADSINVVNEDELNIAEFGMILEDSRLLGGTRGDKDSELTFKEARQAFAGAQTALTGGSDDVKSGSVIGDTMEQMSYAEFLEGIARVAVLKWESQNISFYDKVKWALESVALLAEGTTAADSN